MSRRRKNEITDVGELMFENKFADEELQQLVNGTYKRKKKKNEDEFKYEYVYRLLERHHSVFVSEKTYSKLDESRLGNYTLEPCPKRHPDDKDGYIIWKN